MIGDKPPLINGVSYAHADIVFNVLGVPIIGVTAIEYSDMQTIEANYSTGGKATSVGFGNVVNQGSITMTMEAVQAIQKAAAILPGNRIQDIPFFQIGVNFTSGGVLVRHTLKMCRFKGRNITSQTNNTQIEEKLELFIGDISYNS